MSVMPQVKFLHNGQEFRGALLSRAGLKEPVLN